MAVDIVEIYRFLPRVDCGQCTARSCMAFARLVVEDMSVLSGCTRITPAGVMLIKSLFARGQ